MKKKLSLAIYTALTSMTIISCHSDNNSSTPTPTTPATRFSSVDTSPGVNGGEILIDTTNNITWINDVALDPNSDGCVSPANLSNGTPEPVQANAACSDQTFGGFNDWRAPTSAEITDLITSAQAANVTMKYLNATCPALVGSDGYVRTENSGNAAVVQAFPNAQAGALLASVKADLQGVPAGVRCVRDGVDQAPTQARFSFARAEAANRLGRTLIDTEKGLEWINQNTLDSQGEGCVLPNNGGPFEPTASNTACANQTFAGHNDWRAPTSAELTELITSVTVINGVEMEYLNRLCPALVGTDAYIRTENANQAAATAFPNANAGDQLATTLAGMTVNGTTVPAGVRCVRDITP